jgi:hypothetical protein
MRTHSQTIALCGLLTALAVTILLLGPLFPAATFCAPLLAMAALLPVLEECGPRAALTAYGAASLLSLLLVSDPEASLVFVFFGWYPVLRPRIAALPSRALRLVCRLAICNGVIFLLYGVVLSLLLPGLLAEDLSGPWYTAALLVMANALFLMLDLALGRLTSLWRRKLRRRFLP